MSVRFFGAYKFYISKSPYFLVLLHFIRFFVKYILRIPFWPPKPRLPCAWLTVLTLFSAFSAWSLFRFSCLCFLLLANRSLKDTFGGTVGFGSAVDLGPNPGRFHREKSDWGLRSAFTSPTTKTSGDSGLEKKIQN